MTFGLIGYPLSHSFSRPYFTKKFAELGLSATHRYLNFELADVNNFPKILQEYPDLRGLNVTIPHKQAVLPFLDVLSPAAQEIGAVNTILFEAGQLIGHNTDMMGFKQDVLGLLSSGLQSSNSPLGSKPNLGSDETIRQQLPKQEWLFGNRPAPVKSPVTEYGNEKALVLGTGGASLAVHYALRALGFTTQAVSRRPGEGKITYEDITPERLAEYTLVVNTTPLGMSPRVTTCPNLPYAAFSAKHYCYDLVYNPGETRFLQLAAAAGAKTRNGLGMLYGQAEAAWKIWNHHNEATI